MSRGMKTILICTEDIQKKPKYMKDKLGRLDLLGQILYTGYSIEIHDKIESPAHQGTVIHPFSVRIRERAHNTELTLKLLRNAEHMSGSQQLEAANTLLEEHDIYLERI